MTTDTEPVPQEEPINFEYKPEIAWAIEEVTDELLSSGNLMGHVEVDMDVSALTPENGFKKGGEIILGSGISIRNYPLTEYTGAGAAWMRVESNGVGVISSSLHIWTKN